MSDMLVNYGSLDTLAAAMAQGATQSQADLDAMDAELRPTQSGWSGEAQLQYTATMSECNAAIADRQQLIQQLGTHVNTSSENYNTTDHQAAGTFA